MARVPVIFLLGALLARADAEKAFHCTWDLNLGSRSTDALHAPLGLHKYMVELRDGPAMRAVLEAVRGAFSEPDVSSVREMKALGNVFTAKLTSAAVRWLCEQEHLDHHILAVELDQPVSLMGGIRVA